MPMNLSPGDEPLPGYRLLRRLGSGGFGEVWEAEETKPRRRKCALKFISLEREFEQRIEQQSLQIVHHIHHPHLLEIDFCSFTDDYFVIKMPLCGKSLKRVLEEYRDQEQAGIPRDELLGYMEAAADGLDYLNGHWKVQHRDIKPSNLYLVGNSIKVGDFSIVKKLDRSFASDSGKTSFHYMPPEIIHGKVSNKSDQYSLALTYCELLTGHLPMRHSLDLSALPRRDRKIVRHALAPEPKDRYACCIEFVEELKNASRRWPWDWSRKPPRPGPDPPGATPTGSETRNLAIMFTDMAGSTKFAQDFGNRRAYEKRERHNELLLPFVEKKYKGTLINIIGDALVITFADAKEAARCAIQMLRCLQKDNRLARRDPHDDIHIRVGIHFGPVICFKERGKDEIVGEGANIAARIADGDAKRTDQILISETILDRLSGSPEFVTEWVGKNQAKGVHEPLTIYRLLWQDLSATETGTREEQELGGKESLPDPLPAEEQHQGSIEDLLEDHDERPPIDPGDQAPPPPPSTKPGPDQEISLEEYWRRGITLELTAVAALTAQIGSELAALHHRNRAHGNIRPAIIFGSEENQVWKLGPPPSSVATREQAWAGQAPESLRGEFRPAGDVYALGAILLFCLDPSVRRRATRGELWRQDLDSLPDEWRALIARCLKFDPAARCVASDLADWPAERPEPIKLDVISHGGGAFHLHWNRPSRGTVRIYEWPGSRPPFGQVTLNRDLAELGRWLNEKSPEMESLDLTVPADQCQAVGLVTVEGSAATTGHTVELNTIPEVTIRDCRLRDGALLANWTWPEGIRDVHVVVAADRMPEGPTDTPTDTNDCIYRDWTCTKDDLHGGFVLEQSELPHAQERLYVVVYAKKWVAGKEQFAPGRSAGSQRMLELRRFLAVRYALKRARGGARSAPSWELELILDAPSTLPGVADVPLKLPEMVLYGCLNQVPLYLGDGGEVLGRVSAGIRWLPHQPLRITVKRPLATGMWVLRLFPVDKAEYDVLTLRPAAECYPRYHLR